MPLRLYADECVDARVVAGLRRRSIDVVAVADEHLRGASDEAQLARAATLGRAILTADADFLALVHQRAASGERHPGVIFILPRTGVGDAIRAVAFVAETLDQHEIENWIEWVP